MEIDRRTWLKVAALGTAGAAVSQVARAGVNEAAIAIRSPGRSGRDYRPVLDELGHYARAELEAVGLPGIAISLVDDEGFQAVVTLGWADIGRKTPIAPAQFFQIGSISKSFAALCVYRLADAGRIDLEAPLSAYLPEAPLPPERISIREVLSHTAGLPTDTPVFPRVPGGRLWTGFTPGSNFSYSNVGYMLMGRLVEAVTGRPYPLALRELVVEPLGMTDVIEVIQAKDRARYPIGYSPLDVNGPDLTRTPLGETPWVDRDDAAGSIGATADAMAIYVRYLIAVGQGRGAPLLSDQAARRFATPVAQAPLFGAGARYANGLAVIDLDGHAALHHTGGMIAFSSSITVDPISAVGCFASVNGHMGDYRPSLVTNYACRLLRAIKEGVPRPPSRPEPPSLDRIGNAGLYGGRYVTQDGERIEVQERDGKLFLSAGGAEGRLQSAGEDAFQTDHPQMGYHLFFFEREGGKVISAWWGAKYFGRGVARQPPATPPNLASLAGFYVSDGAWIGSAAVVVQGDRVVLERYGALEPEGDFWRVKSEESLCERVRFEDVMGGKPRRLNISGQDLWRFESV